LKKEALDRKESNDDPHYNDSLYPILDDPNFNIKIAEKKEFYDTQYDGTIADVKKQAEILSKADFEIAPHQQFVKNFLSFETPYNSLLLFHGLGTGKTLTSIGVCEEQRRYMKQTGMNKRIMIVASPNVQVNFRNQIFDERKLKKIDGIWTMNDVIGAQILKEINPMQINGYTKEKIVAQAKQIIQQSYLFLGYIEFANYIEKIKNGLREKRAKNEEGKHRSLEISLLQREFNDRLLVIDEIHNIRISDDNENKNVAERLLDLVKSAKHMRLLLLSATPMYNNYKEIIWLLNLMNINDRRATLKISDVFDKDGNFKVSE
jgi:hypothetical protein